MEERSGNCTLLAVGRFRIRGTKRCCERGAKKEREKMSPPPVPPIYFSGQPWEKMKEMSQFSVFFGGEMLDVLNHHRAEFNDIAS